MNTPAGKIYSQSPSRSVVQGNADSESIMPCYCFKFRFGLSGYAGFGLGRT